MNFAEEHKIVNCFNSNFIPANEDIYDGNPAGDVINMQDWRQCYFIIQRGAGATGTALLTVESCDTVGPGVATPIPYMSRTLTTATDTWSAWTARLAAGYTTVAGANTASAANSKCQPHIGLYKASGEGLGVISVDYVKIFQNRA